jgi:protein TonB
MATVDSKSVPDSRLSLKRALGEWRTWPGAWGFSLVTHALAFLAFAQVQRSEVSTNRPDSAPHLVEFIYSTPPEVPKPLPASAPAEEPVPATLNEAPAEPAPIEEPRPAAKRFPKAAAAKQAAAPESSAAAPPALGAQQPVAAAVDVEIGGTPAQPPTKAITAVAGPGNAAAQSPQRTVPGSHGEHAVDWRGYGSGVHQAIARAREYPYAARRLGLQGVVKVEIRLDARGNLAQKPRLVASSGHDVLDHAALAAVSRAAPFPPFPGRDRQREQRFIIPIQFKLDAHL